MSGPAGWYAISVTPICSSCPTRSRYEKISATTDNNNGTYTATITASFTIEDATITATDQAAPPTDISASATLTQTAGPPTKIVLAIDPNSIPADGKTTSTLTSTVSDDYGHQLSGQTVTFSTSDSKEKVSSTTYKGNGEYQATLTASTTPGNVTVSTSDTTASPSIGASGTLTQTPLPPTTIKISVSPTSIPADGTATAVVTATLANELGNPVSGQTVTFSSSDAGQKFGPVTDHGDGTYTAKVTASKAAGTATIKATDAAASLSATTPLVQTAVAATLPFTGNAPLGAIAGGGAALAAGGGALVGLARRRRPRFAHSKRR